MRYILKPGTSTVRVKTTSDGKKIFKCPGCNGTHELRVRVAGEPIIHPSWEFNGDHVKPSFQPSIKCTGGCEGSHAICHSFVTDGQIAFCGDCTNPLVGKTVEIPFWPYAQGEFGGVID